jgi:hypothetical protein
MQNVCRHFMVANATIGLDAILSTYPGKVSLVSILVRHQHLATCNLCHMSGSLMYTIWPCFDGCVSLCVTSVGDSYTY